MAVGHSIIGQKTILCDSLMPACGERKISDTQKSTFVCESGISASLYFFLQPDEPSLGAKFAVRATVEDPTR